MTGRGAAAVLTGIRQRSRGRHARALVGSVGTGIAGQGVLIVSGVLAARLLGVEDRGHLALIVLWPSVLTQLGYLGVPDALVFHIARSPDAWRSILRGTRRFVVAQAALLTVIHAAVVGAVFRSSPVHVVSAVTFTLVAVPVMVVHRYSLAVLQGTGRFRAFNVCRLLPAALYAAGMVAVLGAGVASLWSIAVAWTASLAVSALAAGTVAFRHPSLSTEDSPVSLRELVSFGGRAFLGTVAPAETLRIDQAVVGLLLAPAEFGIYVVALAFTNLPRFVAQSVGLVAYPAVATAPVEDKMRSLRRFLLVGAGLSTLVVLVLEAAITWLIPFFFGEEFAPAIGVARVLVAAALFRSITRILSDGSRGMGRPIVGSTAELVSLIAFFVAAVVLVPLFGLQGASVSVLLSSLVSITAAAALVRRRTAASNPIPA